MAKIFLIGVQNWRTNDKTTGELITGKSYIGLLRNGTPIKFTSKEEETVYTGEIEFDEKKAIDIPIITKLFGGKISYQDGRSFGKDEE